MSIGVEDFVVSDADIKDQNSQFISELLIELEQCREDERSTQNQFLQIISVAGAILGVLFGIGFFQTESEIENICVFGHLTPESLLFFLSCLVFCTAFTYIVTLGTQNVLRYYYIQDIEKRLANLIPRQQDSPFIHWGSYSAPIITRNIHHLSSRHTITYYFCYTTAAICAILFCISLVAIQFLMIPSIAWFDWLTLIVFLSVVIITIYLFFCVTAKANNLSHYAFKTAVSRKNEINKDRFKISFHNFLYFIYPRTCDLQKPMLIIASYFTFAILFNQLNATTLYHLLISLVVFDILACQARFQINDIRGWNEDEQLGKHTLDAGNKTRLAIIPGNKEHKRKLIKLSLIIACCRIIAAILLTLLFGSAVKNQLLLCLAVLVLSTIFYEHIRSNEDQNRMCYYVHMIFVLVGSGYPLRVAVGSFAACPEIWKPSDTISLLMKILLIIALWAYGSFSSTLAWAGEVAQLDERINGNSNNNCEKYHYEYIHKLIIKRLAKRRNDSFILLDKRLHMASPTLALREKGSLKDPWNIAYLVAISMLSAAFISLTSQSLTQSLICLLLDIAICLCYLLSENQGLIIGTVVGTLYALFGIAFSLLTATFSSAVLLVFILKNMVTFTYFFLRYLPQLKRVNISECLNSIANWLLLHLVGKSAFNILKESSSSNH